MSGAMDALFAGVKWKCVNCGAAKGTCDCWVKCECGNSNLKGETCRNQAWHVSKQFATELADDVVADMADGYRLFQNNQNIIGRLKRTIARRAHPIILECFEGTDTVIAEKKEAKT